MEETDTLKRGKKANINLQKLPKMSNIEFY